ncbi:murein biosynthesis integral membrane protein MurJ [Mangrovactinospora gilvigrisea]|uniref:Murein biosynthesis integral membrane protein MurJ n=1 Tax=Mangrovactinospora gilvigrisea TaxID=1428644 RepID=A0A1J7BEW5_9ACTN|nr:murein biosynthesis integral membrane protein MurJ [Mangrovactinospora gilvigrisea]OIV37227.1 murein biosynthesis integral membrane protein MurJ [Mangrovactinospora gilvigrisea]
MNAPYDSEPGSGSPGEGGRRDDAYTRDTYRQYSGYGEDDPYTGVDDLISGAEENEERRRQQQHPLPPQGQQYPQYSQQPPQPPQDPRTPQDPRAPQPPQQPYGGDPAQGQYPQQPYPQQQPQPQQYGGQQQYGQQPQQPYDQQQPQQPGYDAYGAHGAYAAVPPEQGPAPYDPRAGGYTTAQFMAGQFEETAPPYDYDNPPQPGPPLPPVPPAGAPQPYAPHPQQYPQPPQGEQPQPQQGEAAPATGGGRVGGLMRSSAVMASGTLVSRLLGFVRNLVLASAIGINVLGDSYGTANTLPTLLYILIAGGALNAVFVPQLVRSMKNDKDGGEAYANRLLTLVGCILLVLVVIAVAAAPFFVRLVSEPMASNPDNFRVTVAFARYCLPTIFFMGLHVVLGQILNARNRFGAMMWTPVLNNIVIITSCGLFIWVYGPFRSTHFDPATVPDAGVRLLGIGTLLGLVVQALAMIPYVRDAGLRFRPRFDWRGHGLGHAARLARWTFLFVLANQAGLLVTTQLATAAGSAAVHQGFGGAGLAAYQNALQIWQLPQAAITVSIMTAVLPRISRAAVDGDHSAVRDDLSYGLRTSAVAIVPCAFLFLALGPQIGGTLFGIGTGSQSSQSLGIILMAFSLGLIPFSAQYVMLRGFYAYEDTKTPFYNTVWVAACTAALSGIAYLVLPARFAVAGMAAGYGIAYLVGVVVASGRLRRRLGDLDGARIMRTYLRLCGACVPATIVAYLVARLISHLIGASWFASIAGLAVGAAVFLPMFVIGARLLRIEEMNALVATVRGKLGR